MEAPPGLAVDELDDRVGEEGVGQHDALVTLDDEGAGVGHAGATGGGEQGAGERRPVQGDEGQLLDRDAGERRDPRAHGVEQRRRDDVVGDELIEQQGVAAGQLDEPRPRRRVEVRVQLPRQVGGGAVVERWHLEQRHGRVTLEAQGGPAGHDERDTTDDQRQHVERAGIGPVSVLDDQRATAQLGGDVRRHVGRWAGEGPGQGVGQRMVREVGERLEGLPEDEWRGAAASGARWWTCRCPQGRARPPSCPCPAAPSGAWADRPSAPHQERYPGWHELGRRCPSRRPYSHGRGRRGPMREWVEWAVGSSRSPAQPAGGRRAAGTGRWGRCQRRGSFHLV